MEFQISLTPQAERDLERIGRHIARDNEQAARTFCQELLFEAKSLRTFPQRLGTFAKRPNIRKLPYRNYLIFYKINEEDSTVEILRFWHAAQNQRRLRLKEESPAYASELELRRHQLASSAVIPGEEILLGSPALQKE